MRRSRIETLIDVLDAIHASEHPGSRASASRIQAKTNLSYRRFWRHVEELKEKGLARDEPLRLTAKGRRVLADAHAVLDALGNPDPD